MTTELATIHILQNAGWELGALATGPGGIGHSIRIGRATGPSAADGFEYRDVWGATPEIAYLRAQEAAAGEEPGTRCADLYDTGDDSESCEDCGDENAHDDWEHNEDTWLCCDCNHARRRGCRAPTGQAFDGE